MGTIFVLAKLMLKPEEKKITANCTDIITLLHEIPDKKWRQNTQFIIQ